MSILRALRSAACAAALTGLSASVAGPASADVIEAAPVGCGGHAWSYAIARDRTAPRGVHAVGPQTYCAEVARESPSPLGPIGIVIDPFSDRTPPGPVRPRPR